MKQKLFLPLILVILSLIPLVDLMHPGLPITHDGQDHVARIANFYANLQQGNIIPRWAANLNWGYGHPILMFLYPLPSYAASFFHFLGFSLVDSTKIIFGLAFILSGLFMYVWLRCLVNEKAALAGGLLYMFAPYRFVDLYVRGAIGEHAAFVFPPLLLYFLFKSANNKSIRYVVGSAITMGCLILAHNAISIMFLPLIIFYVGYLSWTSNHTIKFLFKAVFSLLLGFGVSAFFWMPAFMEGKYTLRDIVTKGGVENNFSPFSHLLFGPWSYGISGEFTVQIGFLHWVSVIAVIPLIFYYFKKKNKNWVLILGLLLLFIITAFLMTPSSHLIWEKISLLQKFQFPWRFLSISVFAASVLGAFLINIIPKNMQKFSLIILIILILFLNKDYWHVKSYLQKPESYFTGIYNSTTDTGESTPIWSVRFMEKRSQAHMQVIQGNAKIAEKERISTKHVYSVVATTKTRLVENTLYFPGWKVLVDGKPVNIQFQDMYYRGLDTFFVDPGQHTVNVIFTETKLRLFADVFSGLSLFVIFILAILRKKLWEN